MKLCVAVSLAHLAMPDSAVSDDLFVQIKSPPPLPPPPLPPGGLASARVTISGMSTSADNVDAGAGVVARTVSPDGVSTDPAHEPPPEDVSRSLFSDDEMIDPNDIPSQHICSFIQEPPINAVHFDVPNANGGLSEQVYEHSSLYRFIATPGMLRARRNVFHPHNQECVPRTASSRDSCFCIFGCTY